MLGGGEMKERMLTGFLLCACCVLLYSVGFAEQSAWQEISGGNTKFTAVLVNRNNPKVIYAGTHNAVLKTADAGQTWRSVLPVKGRNTQVNFLQFWPKDTGSIYAATGNGLFVSSNQGATWQRIFKGKNYLENECTAVEVLPAAIYLGTKSGLFLSEDKGRSWHKQGALANNHILAIACRQDTIPRFYIACSGGVFKTGESPGEWEKVFVAKTVETEDDIEEGIGEVDEPRLVSGIRYIYADNRKSGTLYLATSHGVYESPKGVQDWELLTTYGLLSKQITFLSGSPDSILYAAAQSGVFTYDGLRWHELPLGVASGAVACIDFDTLGNMYLACDKGLFRVKAGFFGTTTMRQTGIEGYFKDEANIAEVQQAAVHYAEVEPEKIARWRKQAGKKAFLPKVSAGVNRDVSDLWHWESGSSTKSGDDYLLRGKDTVEWDVTLTWDLGEIIWSNDQTSIDVRSRLSVELRDDILDQVTKLYFERARVKMELNNLSIEDRKKRFEKELRLQELTAMLDGFTGGFFSRSVTSKPVALEP
jgi:hypothetical protein